MAYIGDDIGKQLALAQEREKAGKAAEAADAWAKASELMKVFAMEASSEESRQRRIAKALEYARNASAARGGSGGGRAPAAGGGRPAAGPAAGKGPGAPAGGEAREKAGEGDDGYRRAVQGLRFTSPVRWDDLGGMDRLREQLDAFFGVMLARKPEGVRLDSFRNILFYGPPGTGKTMVAAALSNQLGATFFNVKASDLLSKWYGESSKLISALYAEARSTADTGLTIVFVDEFDGLCRSRENASGSSGDVQVIGTLLAELDGLSEKGEDSGVLTIAATNRPEALDEAIRSRFQAQFEIPLPDAGARREIARKLLKKAGIEIPSALLEQIVGETEGFSGRDLQGLVRGMVNHMVMRSNPRMSEVVRQGQEALQAYTLRVNALEPGDLEAAFRLVKPRK